MPYRVQLHRRTAKGCLENALPDRSNVPCLVHDVVAIGPALTPARAVILCRCSGPPSSPFLMCYGLPFASPNGRYNLSKLSVWWLRLGIAIEPIKPGTPTQNGRHERCISP